MTSFRTSCNTHIAQYITMISQSKGNHTMKSGQLIEYNKRNIFSKIVQKMRQEDCF